MTAGVTVDGMKQLIKTMRQAGEDMADMKDANQAAATVALHGADQLVPRASGRLASSGRTARQAARARFQFGSARIPYAAIVHWGWPARGVPADTYGTDGARKTEPIWTATYTEALQAIVNRVRGA